MQSSRSPLLLLPFLVVTAFAADLHARSLPGPVPTTHHYTLALSLQAEEGLLRGRLEVRFENRSNRPLTEIPLFLYPNLFSHPDQGLDDVTFPHRFPGGFSAGGMTLDAPRVNGVPAAVEMEDHNGLAGIVAWLRLEQPIAPGGMVTVRTDFETTIPHRFGPFGRVDGATVLLGGWHPAVPAIGTDGFELDNVHVAADYALAVQCAGGGLLVLGDRLFRLSDRETLRHETAWEGPLLFYFRRHFGVASARREGREVVRQVVASAADTARPDCRRVLDAVTGALAEHARLYTPERPFLVLQAPLRESMVLPVRGGILVSELAFSVFPLESLLRQHGENIGSAVFAAALLSSTGMDLFDALLTINLIQFVRWEEGRSDPIFLRRFFQTTEFWGSLDKMGTDPQAHFQSSMFFTPELPDELRRTFSLFAVRTPSPRTAARLLFDHLGVARVKAALTEALARKAGLVGILLEQAAADEAELLRNALAPMAVDLVLEGVEKGNGGWSATVCKPGLAATIPVELWVRSGRQRHHLTELCAGECCTLALPGTRKPRVQLDPFGVFLQQSSDNQHPRYNDRNYPDLKWILNRPYMTMAGGDRLPTMGVELLVEPRWDLRNKFFLSPSMTPGRGTVMAGWRASFGPRIRPNFLSESITLGLRVALSLEGDGGSLFGPALNWVHYTRQSRMNPFAGNWSYLFAYPNISWDGRDFGIRLGGMTSQMFGPSPDHVFAVRVNADTAFGWVPEWDVPSTGGIDGLRAAGATALSDHHRVGANVEYRWMVVRSGNTSLARLLYLTGLQVAFFLDGATISDRLDGLFAPDSLYVDAGIGLRPHFDIFGVLPGIVALDLAWMPPVLGADEDGFNVVLSFYQPF